MNTLFKYVILGLISSISIGASAQGAKSMNSDIKVKANINAGCFLTTENINFGVIAMPISNQSTSSNMQVKCSKGVASVIQISYTPNGATTSATYSAVQGAFNGATHYRLYKDGAPLTINSLDIACNAYSKVFFYNQTAQSIYGLQGYSDWVPDIWNICSGIQINTTTLSNLGSKSQGTLLGLSKGEKVIYALEVPGNASQNWNIQNKYNFTTTGETQVIPMKANIKSAGNPTYRLSPDIYQDILTVILTY